MSKYDMSIEALVKGCKQNDPIAQRHLYDKFAKKMMGICMRYSDNVEEAEDVLQNGFIKVFQSIGKFRGDGSLEGWLRKIMVNSALDNYRRSKASKKKINLEEIEFKFPSDNYQHGSVDSEALMKIINSLPTGFKTVFNLYAIEGYTHKEIGEKLGISENTSKSQYSRARAHLQRMIRMEKIID